MSDRPIDPSRAKELAKYGSVQVLQVALSSSNADNEKRTRTNRPVDQ